MGEDKLVTDTQPWQEQEAFTFHFCVWHRLQNSVIIKTQ